MAQSIAEKIYLAHFGHLDDKVFEAEKTQEIIDWLTDGDPNLNDVDTLISEWAEYDAEDVEANKSPF